MHNYHEALSSYEMAKDFAEAYLGDKDSIYLTMNGIYIKAKKEIDQKKKKRKLHEERLASMRTKARATSATQKAGFKQNNTYNGANKGRRNISAYASATGVRPKAKRQGQMIQTQMFGVQSPGDGMMMPKGAQVMAMSPSSTQGGGMMFQDPSMQGGMMGVPMMPD